MVEVFKGWDCPVEQCDYSIEGDIEMIMTAAVEHYQKYHEYENGFAD